MTVRRRSLVKRGLGTVIAAGVGMPLYLPAARAQTYPSKPITFIVPWPAGGSSDITLRAMCERAGKVLGQPFQIDNKHAVTVAEGARVLQYDIDNWTAPSEAGRTSL